MRRVPLLLGCVVALSVSGFAAQAEIFYRWTTPSGAVFLTNHDPPPFAQTIKLPDLPRVYLPPPPTPTVVNEWDWESSHRRLPGGTIRDRQHVERRTREEPAWR